MEFDKIRAYLFQTVLVLASMSHSFFPSAASSAWQLLLKLNGGGWQHILLVVVAQLFGFQLLRGLWYLFQWAFFAVFRGKKENEHHGKDEHIISRIHTIESRLNACDTRLSGVDTRIEALNNRVYTAFEKIEKLKKD
jgi:hypothetical protein